MDQSLKDQVSEYLEGVIQKFWSDSRTGRSRLDLRQLRPFQYRLSPQGYTSMSAVSKHSYDTRSGNWWKNVALMIAKQLQADAVQEYRVTENMSPAAESVINEILVELENNKRQPDRRLDIGQVLSAQFTAGQPRSEHVDLYVKRHDGRELYFEMKTPEPNSRDSRDMKRMILFLSAMKKGTDSHAYGSCAYNPSGDGNPFQPNPKFVAQYLEVHQDFLVGREFWEAIGDNDTYDDLLGICDKVGQISDQLFANLRNDPP